MFAVSQHKGTEFVRQGIQDRIKTMERAELEGRYFDAAYVWGDSLMQVYMIARPIVGGARIGINAIRQGGIRGAFGQAWTGVRNFGRNLRSVWKKPFGESPPGLRAVPRQGDILFETEDLRVARARYRMRAALNSRKAYPQQVEVGLYRRQLAAGRYQYAVVRGCANAVDPPDGTWSCMAHFHPGALETPGFRLPSPPDLTNLAVRAAGGGVTESILHSVAADGSLQAVHFGIDPVTADFWVRDIGARPMSFPMVEPTVPVPGGYIALDPFDYYGGWWARTMRR